MDSLLTQLGVGGIFMILTFRELLQFLGRGYKNRPLTIDPAGERPAEYWNQQISRMVATGVDPLDRRMQEIQRRLVETMEAMERTIEANSSNINRLSDNIGRMSENIARLLERRQRER